MAPRVTRMKRTGSKPAAKRERDNTLYLPTEPNEPPTSLDDVIIMLYGRKNIGKSSLAAAFPDSLTMMAEAGRKNLSIMQVPKQGEPALTWNRCLKYRDMVCESDQFSRVNFDTVDQMYQLCFTSVCKDAGVRHPDSSAKPYELWNGIKAEFKEFVLSFREAGKGVTFVSHEKIKPLITKAKGLKRDGEDESSVKIDRIEPSCTGQVMDVVTEICDYVLYYHYKDAKRAIMVRSPQDIAWTACGMGETFCDPNGNLIECFEVGNSAAEAYENIVKAFNNELYDMDYVPPPKERVSTLTKRNKTSRRKR